MTTINGTSGNDSYDHYGSDALIAFGSSGSDSFWGNTADDSLYGDDGNDTLRGWTGNDYLSGGNGNDSLFGEGSNDTLDGGAGDDRLDGYATSGIELDVLTGGTGSDTFVLGGSWGVSYLDAGFAVITDFSAADDYIEVVGSSSQYSFSSINLYGSNSVQDTAISYNNSIIAIVQDTSDVSISRDFKFV